MNYTTTTLQPEKSYPTYQFHAFTASEKLGAGDVFKVCVLETLNWLRQRMVNFPRLPDELRAPLPDEYESFPREALRSFNLNMGASVDCTYIQSEEVWSLRITEPDAGENIGKPNERPPINGRTFRTEIAFRQHTSCVEAGIRITVSEPANCDAPCAVYRPAIVKALANDPKVRFVKEGFAINGSPLSVTNSTEFRNLETLFLSGSLNLPIVLVADSKAPKKAPAMPDIVSDISSSGFGSIASGAKQLLLGASTLLPELDYSDSARSSIENRFVSMKTVQNEEDDFIIKPAPGPEKPEEANNFDYTTLASWTLGFAAVCFVGESCFERVKNRLGITIGPREILVCVHGRVEKRCRYTDANMDELKSDLTNELKAMPKRRTYKFGDVLFYSDARLQDLKVKLDRNMSLEEELKITKLDNEALRAKLRETEQHNTDMQLSADSNRLLRKQLSDAQDRAEKLEAELREQKADSEKKAEAYRKASDIVTFYKQRIAETYPTEKDDVCTWVKEKFSGNIILTSRAENALKRYNSDVDISMLCDGICFINAYADYRAKRIDKNTLDMYAESYNWSVTPSGDKSLQVHKKAYTIVVDNTKYLLEWHIKSGVSTAVLLRIYFCWDADLKKMIIGYMPDHLPIG